MLHLIGRGYAQILKNITVIYKTLEMINNIILYDAIYYRVWRVQSRISRNYITHGCNEAVSGHRTRTTL